MRLREPEAQRQVCRNFKSASMPGALREVFPDAMYQRCTVHFYRKRWRKCPTAAESASPPSSRPYTPRSCSALGCVRLMR